MDRAAVDALRTALANERQRAAVIAALAPDLPAAGIQHAVDAALHLSELGHDASAALRAVAARVIELDNPWLLVGAGESLAQHVADESVVAFVGLAMAIPAGLREPRHRVLGEAAVRLAAGRRTDGALLLLELASHDPDHDWVGGRAAAIAPYLTAPAEVERLVAVVGRLAPSARAATLVELAPRLGNTRVLLSATEQMEAPLPRFRLFAAWVGTLPPERRPAAARRLFAAAKGASRGVVACALSDELRAEAPAAVEAIIDELERAVGEPSWIPDPWFWEAVEWALGDDASDRRRAAGATLLRAAHGLDAQWRVRALDALARLPEADLAQLLDLAGEMVYGRPHGPTPPEERAFERLTPPLGGWIDEPAQPAVEEILSRVPPEDRSDLVMAALAPAMAKPKPSIGDLADDLVKSPDEDIDLDEEYDDEEADFDDYYMPAPPRAPDASWPGPAGPVVNTGFADPEDPGRGLDPRRRLQPGDVYFWVEVGEEDLWSIETAPASLTASVEPGGRVTVALFPVTPGLEVLDDTGELEVVSDGSAVVVRPAAPVEDPTLARRRLAFRLRIEPGTRDIELRCSMFCRQLLVQSRLIRALVSERPTPPEPVNVATSEVDYMLVRSLEPARLRDVAEHGLSLMVNGNGSSHNLHAILPDDDAPITHSTRFEGGELQDMILQARRALRTAAFGSPEPWRDGDVYQYDEPADPARLEEDLLELAVRGYRFYDACITRLVGGRAASRRFEEGTLRPTRIQIALKQHGGLLLPAALFYDSPLDTTRPDLRLCPAFLGAQDDVEALTALPCFNGECPAREDVTVVCPSGFWGYRHDLGLPLSVDELGDGDDMTAEIGYDAQPHLGVAVSTDPRFVLRAAHERELRALRPDLGWHYAPTREDAIELMRDTPTELLYFYCHGGVSQANAPFLCVGGVDEPGITSDVFRAYRIWWSDPRPLVFINGCHTTALEPDSALDFVSRLVDTAGAAGVIGTEITTFEPLAGAFATECLRRFLGGEEIGSAVRGARLALLARGNPLGLIYIPFVIPTLRLVARG